MSTTTTKMSFAERMMAKMGHEVGKGLGKDGEGIVDPIEPSQIKKGTGLGYEAFAAEEWKSLVENPEDWETTKSNIVSIWNLPRGTEPGCLYRMFDEDEKSRITEIEIPRNNSLGFAYVTFTDEAAAEAAADKYTGRSMHAWGPQDCKLRVDFVSKEHASTEKKSLLLSDFLRDRDEESAIQSRTVLVTKLPQNNPVKSLKMLLKDAGFNDSDYGDEPYHTTSRDEARTAAVKFRSPEVAKDFVDQCNGDYWKNSTIYAKCIPEKECVVLQQPDEMKDTTMLFVSNLPVGFSANYVRNVFTPTKLTDISIPGKRGTFAFAYVPTKKVAEILKKFPKSRDGRTIYAAEGRNRNNTKREAPVRSPAEYLPVNDPVRQEFFTPLSPRPTANVDIQKNVPGVQNPVDDPPCDAPSYDAYVKNLAYAATTKDIRVLFAGYSIGRVNIKKGFAFVGLKSDEEVQKAIKELDGKILLGRKVFMSKARCPMNKIVRPMETTAEKTTATQKVSGKQKEKEKPAATVCEDDDDIVI